MEFCPTCANLLEYEMPYMDRPGRLACPTCPYICDFGDKVKIKRKIYLVPKKLDPILSLDAMDTAQTTKERCSNCGHDEAAFVEMQTRSADEPATRFYRCKECKRTWCEY